MILLSLVVIVVAGDGSAADNPGPNLKSGIDVVNFDRSTRPQDYFYRYVNGG
jgi:hypothetical protein